MPIYLIVFQNDDKGIGFRNIKGVAAHELIYCRNILGIIKILSVIRCKFLRVKVFTQAFRILTGKLNGIDIFTAVCGIVSILFHNVILNLILNLSIRGVIVEINIVLIFIS